MLVRAMSIRIAAFALGLLLVAPAVAHAWPMLRVTATEEISVDPPRWKTTFTITEEGYRACWGELSVGRQNAPSPEAPTFYGCEGPDPWVCTALISGGNGAYFYRDGGDPAMGEPLSIITDRAAPCVRITFFCPLLSDWAPPPPIEACLSTDLPVPAATTSWGRLKTQYR